MLGPTRPKAVLLTSADASDYGRGEPDIVMLAGAKPVSGARVAILGAAGLGQHLAGIGRRQSLKPPAKGRVSKMLAEAAARQKSKLMPTHLVTLS